MYEIVLECVSVGFLFSTILGHYFIKPIVDSLWEIIGNKKLGRRTNDTLRIVQGCIERFLYTAFYMGNPLLIGLWPGLKVASRWKEWSQKPGFDVSLTGTGLSIIYGVVGAKLIQWLRNEEWLKSAIIGIAVVILSWSLKKWIENRNNNQRIEAITKANNSPDAFIGEHSVKVHGSITFAEVNKEEKDD